MSWESQVSEQILFLSPELNVFKALWKNGDRSAAKKLGVFDPPKFRGSIVQDMDVKSISYPITCYFDGFTHIKDAAKFEKALHTEKGKWDIGHPVYGSLSLQLVDWKQTNDPTGDAAVTIFETNWIEPAELTALTSAPEIGALTLLEILDAISDGILQLQQLRTDLYSAVQSALNIINRIAGIANTVMSELAATQNLINDSWNEAKNTLATVQEAWKDSPFDQVLQSDLGQSFIDVISIPLEASDNYDIRFDYYNKLLDGIKATAPTGVSPEDYNKALFHELAIVGVMTSASKIIVTSEFKTRSEIISAMEKTTTLYGDCINSLDEIQERFTA